MAATKRIRTMNTAKTLEEREGQLSKERQQLENEKMNMTPFFESSAGDLVEINVGGKVMTTTRSTLLLGKDTLLEAIFSGRWDQSLKRDGAGRVFLDFSPVPFKALLSFLRALRDAEPGEPVNPPVVPPQYEAEYKAMVKYLGLAELLEGKTCCPAGALVCSQSTGGTRDGSIQCDGGVLRSSCNLDRCAVGGVRLLGGDGGWRKVIWKTVTWKMTVRALAEGKEDFDAGVIGNSSPGDDCLEDPTSFVWGSSGWVCWGDGNGERNTGEEGWPGWHQGDVAIFQLSVSSGLRMYLRRSQWVYSMPGVSTDMAREARLLFRFTRGGTEVAVSQATVEDLKEAGF